MGFFADSIYQKFSIRVEIMALRYCVTVLILTLISSTILKIKIKKKNHRPAHSPVCLSMKKVKESEVAQLCPTL